MVTNMPDISRFRRPPVLLPPMTRQTDSIVSGKKVSSHAKTTAAAAAMTEKSTVKVDQLVMEKEREDRAR